MDHKEYLIRKDNNVVHLYVIYQTLGKMGQNMGLK